MSELDKRADLAKRDQELLNALISEYTPFIVARVVASLGHSDDEAIQNGMIAFCEAVNAFDCDKGSFLSFAQLVITRRMTDFRRKEFEHEKRYHDIDPEKRDWMFDTISFHMHNLKREQEERCEEIARLKDVLKEQGITFSQLAEAAPRQERSKKACRTAIMEAIENPQLVENIKKGRVPIKELAIRCGISVKSLEKHRRYLLAAVLIHVNGFLHLSQYVPLDHSKEATD